MSLIDIAIGLVIGLLVGYVVGWVSCYRRCIVEFKRASEELCDRVKQEYTKHVDEMHERYKQSVRDYFGAHVMEDVEAMMKKEEET